MNQPFIGSEAVAAGDITKTALRRRFTRVFFPPDVYVAAGTELDAQGRARAGWLWSGGRKAVIAGRSAAALHGAKWIDRNAAVDLIHDNRNRRSGVNVRGDRLGDSDFQLIYGLPVTTPLRTALDLACWYPRNVAVPTLDSLARATSIDPADARVLAERYPGRRAIRMARESLSLVDGERSRPRRPGCVCCSSRPACRGRRPR